MKRALLFTGVALLNVSACLPHNSGGMSETEEANSTQTIRIIIGFSNPDFDHDKPAFLKILSQELGSEVTFLRSLSGNAALYLCQLRHPIDSFLTRLKNLSALSDIEYAEPDQRRQK